MAELKIREAKLVQYLNEAYGKERQLETALEAHIEMATRPTYRKRLQEHLRETRSHAKEVKRRIKQLGGSAEPVSLPGPDVVAGAASKVQEVAQRGAALAQGPLHAVRGTGEEERQLKNAKTEYQDEAEEIANYTAIETLADTVGDRDTARLARSIRRQEERMSSFLEKLIPTLTKEVVKAEIPPAERNGAARRRRTGSSSRAPRSTKSASSSRNSRGTGSSRKTTGSRKTTSTRGRATSSRAGASRKRASSARASGRRATASSSRSRASASRGTTRRSTASRSSASSRSGARSGRGSRSGSSRSR